MTAWEAYKILKHAAYHCRTADYPDGIIREVTQADMRAAKILEHLRDTVGAEEYTRTQLKRARKYFTVQEIHLNNGGYDRTGKYFGLGPKLFQWEYKDMSHGDGDIHEQRAASREDLLLRLARRLPSHLS